MRYGSTCSGIEAASQAWQPLGFSPSFLSEIADFPRAVLQHHHKDVPLHGDFTTIQAGQYAAIDVLVGGTPCQSFSVAGLRGGMADERGNLALEYLRLADRLRPRWLVWENVPGILSSNGGRDFGSFVGGMVQLGYGFAYRVLDAQYFGLAQRRKRVFVVGYLGDWRRAASVLFEPACMRGDNPPSRKTGQRVASPIAAGSTAGSGYRNDADTADNLIAFGGNDTRGSIEVATACNAHGGPHGRMDFESETFVTHALRADGFDASEDGTGRGTPIIPVAFSAKDDGGDACFDITPTLLGQEKSFSGHNMAVMTLAIRGRGDSHELETRSDGTANALLTPNGGRAGIGCGAIAQPSATANTMSVRRLTPRECERLQGFPDDFTLIPYRGKPAADGNRYKALGNSMAVPVMAWIGRAILAAEAAHPSP